MRCDQIKFVSVSEGMYAISAEENAPPCRYTVRWCPKDGQVVTLIEHARAQKALRTVREHRVLGDTIEHLMGFTLN